MDKTPTNTKKGDDTQRLNVLQDLPQLLETHSDETITKIIPKIQTELPTSSCEFQLATSKMFRLLLEKDTPINVVHSMLIGIESMDPVICNTWLETLVVAVPHLDLKIIEEDVFPLAVSKSDSSNTLHIRLASCRLIGKIALHKEFTPIQVKNHVLPLVLSLCQDVSPEVRAAMCAQLPIITQTIGLDGTCKSSLLSCIVELSSDENAMVRMSTVDAVIQMIPYLDPRTIKETMLPLVKRLCYNSIQEKSTVLLSAIANSFGLLLKNLQAYFTIDERIWFINFCKEMTLQNQVVHPLLTDNAVNCREKCAQNLPTITMFVMQYLVPQLEIWYSIFKNLAQDSFYMVRKNVAECLYDIAHILGPNCALIKTDVVRLIRDDSEDVLSALVPRLAEILQIFCNHGILSRNIAVLPTLDFGRALLKCQMELFKGHNWRNKETFLKQLECLPDCMPSEFINQHFTPMMLSVVLDGRGKPVRSQGARTLLVYLRYNIKENQRKWIRETITTRICEAESCYTRQIYVDLVLHALDLFSHKYFKEHFFIPLMSLAEDPVANVRLSVMKMEPHLRAILQPKDNRLKMILDHVVGQREMLEKDKVIMEVLVRNRLGVFEVPVADEVAIMEDRRKLEEEERLLHTKPVALPVVDEKVQTTTKEPTVQSTPVLLRKSPMGRRSSSSSSVHPKIIPVSGDMSFLEQHFYIDAGVNLPVKPKELGEITEGLQKLSVKPPSVISVDNIEGLSENSLKNLQTITTNITDDVKVNLQRITDVTKRTKRFSSGFPMESKQSLAVLKRRSLNMPSSDSRIPKKVSNLVKEKSKSVVDVKNEEAVKEVKENVPIVKIPKRASGLPVLKRYPRAPAAKKS